MESSEALTLLAQEIRCVRTEVAKSQSTLAWMREAWHPNSRLSIYRFTSVFFCVLVIFALLSSRAMESIISGVIVLMLTLLNIFLSGMDSYLRKEEILRRTDRVVEELLEEARERRWEADNYPHLHTPLSASIVLQWVIRDNKLVNLPWALLVKGDTILLKPGQVSPARCHLASSWMSLKLEQGETFQMDSMKRMEKSLVPEFKSAVEPEKFILDETPYLAELRKILSEAQNRPISKLNNQRHYFMTIIECFLLLPLVVFVMAWNCFRYKYSWTWSEPSLISIFLLEPVAVAIPLLPLVFPSWWLITNYAGLASVLAHLRFSRIEVTSDPFDDTIETPEMEDKGTTASWHHIWSTFFSCLTGDGTFVSRTENLLHTLGSITSYCCTDKKGILSWQNPSAEKIFFFKKRSGRNPMDLLRKKSDTSDVTAEILTVTHDHNNPFRVEFDDPMWRTNLASLKPLGLSILLNTCNMQTEEKYTHFFQHLLCESMREPLQGEVKDSQQLDLLPIPARGCLCELSARIGLPHGTEYDYELKQQMQTFRPVVPDSPGGDHFTRSLALAKLKFPFPHMVSLVTESKADCSLQLVTQGTADIVIDSCVDAWIGNDLVRLDEDLRKKIMEFYHRASLTSYCSAFSFRPISYVPPWPQSSHYYLELPHNSSPFLSKYVQDSLDSIDRVSIAPEMEIGGADDTNADKSKKVDHQPEFRHDSQNVFGCLEAQCNQTFLAMVQMQYQARVDIVQFIDLLEKACIRFVHFSKENELRSRVFSEKMGLESGWNCHISLRGEGDLRSKTRQMYARKWVTKKFSRESSCIKQFISTSEPCKLHMAGNRCFEFPRAGAEELRARPPGFSGGAESDEDASGESNSGSTDSMLQYDMSNRAQLPCGIENIRPHLEKMDNVPLLVSLFTDCTPASIREMVKIMQENGEVVVTLGSSANYHNMPIFVASDASLAVEPLYPQVCQHVPVYKHPEKGLAPVELAAHLTSISSSVRFKREEEVSMYNSIMASRRHVMALTHTLQFWTLTCLFLSVAVLFCTVITFPSPVSAPQQLFLNVCYLPLIALSLFASASDKNIRNISTGKNVSPVSASRQMMWYASWCYGLRYLLPLLAVVIANSLSVAGVASTCQKNCADQAVIITNVNMTFLTVYIILIALSFVSRTDQMWRLRPRKSWPILATGAIITVGQVIYLAVSLSILEGWVPVSTWIVYTLITPLVVIVNEVIKWQEIKVNVRFQKRARLEFGTKLGINSPF